MREPSPDTEVFGILAEFNKPEALIAAVKAARKSGFRALDAYSPYPLEEMPEALGFREETIPWLSLIGGILGAGTAYGLQLWTNYAYPIEIGGRPIFAWQPFMLITFELAVLFAVLFPITGMLLLNRLPRLHHPIFDVEDFHLASSDKFFLVLFSNDARFDRRRTSHFLEGLKPVRIAVVEHTEEPE
ncbi:DUF3341 domain-containing protein [Mycoplana dimorpha]|uniref:Quinol:cytochrome c oxidoreductase membrane protein n=1 Tax=Mycoplana dimorpha TaxID=28320 RepID=A0A2T5AJR9_MYCDI|nr:DUF3341 domain-containing protein [Mycoplana dimorpha]PTM86957.1 quinol:cytochrome c oxidoreductase membrane protein [Mycoplana dimorpha]